MNKIVLKILVHDLKLIIVLKTTTDLWTIIILFFSHLKYIILILFGLWKQSVQSILVTHITTLILFLRRECVRRRTSRWKISSSYNVAGKKE